MVATVDARPVEVLPPGTGPILAVRICDAARALAMSRGQVMRLLDAGELTRIKTGGLGRGGGTAIAIDDLREFLRRRRVLLAEHPDGRYRPPPDEDP